MALDPVLQLRRMIDEPDSTTYSDAELSTRAGAAQSIFAAARDVWVEKASSAAALVNTSEGGSTRAMSQVYDHYKDMVSFYTELANEASGTSIATGAVLRPVIRV